jgi:hypothetical protein
MLVAGVETGGGVVVLEETPPLVLVVLMVLVLLVRVLLVLLLLGLEEDVEDGTLGVVTWLLGRHWEYQGFCSTQVDPEAQHVAP